VVYIKWRMLDLEETDDGVYKINRPELGDDAGEVEE
jgi:hypothetical protein